MSTTRNLSAVARAAAARTSLSAVSTLSPRSLHSSAPAQKSVVGWLLGKDDKSTTGATEAKSASETPRTAKPPSNTSPTPSTTAQATQTSSSPLKNSPITPSTPRSSKKRPVWPRFKHLHQPDPTKQPRRLEPALDLLADSSHPLSEAERVERFNLLLTYVGDRIGSKPVVRDGRQVRDSSWNQLIQLAITKEQLNEVVEIMPKWIESKREFKPAVAELLIERAHQINATPIVFKPFLDYLRFGLKVPSLDHAGALMCASLQKDAQPDRATLQNIVALSTVLRLQRLPPLGSSILAASSFAGALAHPRLRTPKSYQVLLSVLPALRDLARGQTPVPDAWRKRLAPLLGDVQTYLRLHGVHALWLRAFRRENGLLPAHAETTTWATQVKRDRAERRRALKDVADPEEKKKKAEEMLKEQRKRLVGLVQKDEQFGRSTKAVVTPFTEVPERVQEVVAHA